MSTDHRFVTVAILTDGMAAQLIANLLEADGIPVTTAGAQHSNMLPGTGFIQIRVQVPEVAKARAEELIEAMDADNAELVEDPEEALARLAEAAAPERTAMEYGAGPYRTEPDERQLPSRGRGPIRPFAWLGAVLLVAIALRHWFSS